MTKNKKDEDTIEDPAAEDEDTEGMQVSPGNDDDGDLLAENEPVGAWNEDEEEGTVEAEPERTDKPGGYQAGPGAEPAPSEKPDKSRRRFGSKH
jgi:hypothetical protein